MKLIRFFGVATLTLALCLTSCSGEDGADGIDGIDGVDGTNGTNGTNGADGADGADGQDGADGLNGIDGQDGADGVGFDELTQFGYMTLELDGTRIDDVVFQDSNSFKFTNVDANSLPFTSGVEINGNDYTFSLVRFFSTPDNVYQDTFLQISILVTDLGGNNEAVEGFTFDISNYAVVGDDNKYFILNETYDANSAGLTNAEFTNIAFDEETNHLTFSYSISVDGENNPTTYELTMSGMADVTVLEEAQAEVIIL